MFHLGHLDLVRQILKECNEVIILVTSSQFNYLEKDPFTAGERIEMIHNSLKESDVDLTRCIILAIENQFNVDIEVIKPVFLDRDKFNATKIRHMIISDEPWDPFVPSSVSDFIKKINGIKRLKIIAKSDTKPTEH